ncbi:hypothetical protein [Vibrio marisflavi]|nr:hypothetical protein [Vibrio marisflavi]
MITEITLPPADYFKKLIDEVITDAGTEAFIEKHLAGINKVLSDDPLSYRNYGAYWWAIKKLMNERGYELGDDEDPITSNHFTYSDPVTLLCAAWAYQDGQIEDGYMYQSKHTYPIVRDGDEDDIEDFEYSLEDHDLEARAVNQI